MKSNTTKILVLVASTLLLTPVWAEPRANTSLTESQNISSQLVANVNGETISMNALERAVDVLVPRTFLHGAVTGEKRDKLKKQALDELIEQRLIIQHAKNIGIKISADELRKEEIIIAQNTKSKEEFLQALTRARFSTYAEFKKTLEGDLLLQKLYQRAIKTTFSDTELKTYYEDNLFKFKEPEKIKIKVIYIRQNPVDPDGSKKAQEKAHKKAKEAYNKIIAGANFSDIAAEYSDAMSGIKGGDISFTHRGRFDPIIDETAFALKVGEVSEIVKDTKGYYIILLEEKKQQNLIPFEIIKDRLRKQLISKEEDKKRESLHQKLKQEASIEIFQTIK